MPLITISHLTPRHVISQHTRTAAVRPQLSCFTRKYGSFVTNDTMKHPGPCPGTRLSQTWKTYGLLLAAVLVPGLASASPPHQESLNQWSQPLGSTNEPSKENHEISLRHVFHRDQDVHARLDVHKDSVLSILSEDGSFAEIKPGTEPPKLSVSSSPLTIHRLADRRTSVIEDHFAAVSAARPAPPQGWTMDTLMGPDVTDKETVLNFAKMTANDYIEEPGKEDWHVIHGRFNYSSSFGWGSDGLRGHVYADKMNSTVVISLKGTSPALFDGAGTTTNDKENDNLLFSCCCGQGGSYLWRQVCDCQDSLYSANLTCISEALRDENRYYRSALDLYSNVTAIYPNSNVWVTGHSLGGALSGLLGLTFGVPAITFEAVPEALPAARLGLPSPPGYDVGLPQTRRFTGAFHFGHTADPVFMGTCNGINSICTWGGYAMESACHTGQLCTYDTVADKGWRVGIGTHKIKSVISDVIEKYDDVPPCAPDEECVDCVLWKFFKSNGSEITTTTTTTTTALPTTTWTSTCKTPGWWGCLDETTTTTSITTPPIYTTTTTTTTTTSTTCKTPGWFGCNDPTSTTQTFPTQTSSTSTCHHPGWFGCNDPTSTTQMYAPHTSPTSTCRHPGWFWCNDPTSTTQLPPPPTTTSTCRHPGWFWCNDPTSTTQLHYPPTTTSTCRHPGWFWCNDPTSTTQLNSPQTSTSTCHHPGWFWCNDPTPTA